MNYKEIKFTSDTAERKRFFRAASFAHPAKMVLGLQIYLIENYTKPSDTILDPMAGSGTILIACTLGRNVICVELEDKFVKMQNDNWQKLQRLGPMLGHTMGEAVILQGDARQLDNVLADSCIFSPPYAEMTCTGGKALADKVGASPNSCARMVNGYSDNSNNIGNLPYGEIDTIVTSPPYEGSLESGSRHTKGGIPGRDKRLGQAGTYADLDESVQRLRKHPRTDPKAGGDYGRSLAHPYSGAEENIGNLKSESYLQAMLQVYQGSHRVLKDKGIMCLVTKNFIRNKRIVRLDLDTIKLCEQAGFILKERLKRKLTQQSFWRTISLSKCDNRKAKGICKLGLSCPVKKDRQFNIMWKLQMVDKEDNALEKGLQIIEKLCPKFINTMPKIEYEDVLIFEKG